jgi:chaperonin cofactor prefoldin
MVNQSKQGRSLDQRLAERPQLREQFESMLDEIENRAMELGSLDDAEDALVDLTRKLGHTLLSECAREMEAKMAEPPGVQVRRHAKKNSGG